MLERGALATSPAVIEEALELAQQRSRSGLQPLYEAYKGTSEALRKVENDIESVLATASSGQAVGALWEMLNERAFRLKFEREQLIAEQRHLKEQLAPAETALDAAAFQRRLADFEGMRKTLHPEEVQRLLRLLVRRVEWAPKSTSAQRSLTKASEVEGHHKLHFYVLPAKKHPQKQQLAGSMSGQAGFSYCDALRYPVAPRCKTSHL